MAKQKRDLYKQDGVDIDAGDVFSKYAADLSKKTYENDNVKIIDLSRGNFRGPRGWEFVDLPNGFIQTGEVDGVGTKVVLIDAAGNYEDAASNLIAMTAMDITRWGGLPLIFMNILDVSSLGEVGSERFEAAKKVILGLQRICVDYQYVMLTGETAELGVCVGSENPDANLKFNWGGAMIGVYHPDKMILGDTLRPGQAIMALGDDFRSNGISSVRKAQAIKYGSEWWKNPEAYDDILSCASPSKQYDRLLNDLHGWYNKCNNFEPNIRMHLIVHLSGGAFESKLAKDILQPLNLSAEIDNLFDPPEIMRKCALWRGMSDEECYRTWNGGQGAIVVIDEKDVEYFIYEAEERYEVPAKRVGVIAKKKKKYTVAIKSKFGSGKMIYY